MRLYIIGNGFDIAHGIESKYEHFKKWLINRYDIDEKSSFNFEIPYYETNYKGLEEYNEKEFANLFFNLINESTLDDESIWGDFEKTLSRLPWKLTLDNVEEVYDKEGDMHYGWTMKAYEEEASRALESAHLLEFFFSQWAREIEYDNKKSLSRFSILTNDDLFLSFNYTDTLEKLYSIKHVCHIHGRASNYEKLIIGHGEDRFEEEYDDIYDEAYYDIKAIFDHFKKDCIKQINKNKSFFSKLNDVDDIYIYGSSISEADLPYFRYIANLIPNVEVYVNVYDSNLVNDTIGKLKNTGFNTVHEWKV